MKSKDKQTSRRRITIMKNYHQNQYIVCCWKLIGLLEGDVKIKILALMSSVGYEGGDHCKKGHTM